MLIGRYRLFVCVFDFHTYQRNGGYGDTNIMLIGGYRLFVCVFDFHTYQRNGGYGDTNKMVIGGYRLFVCVFVFHTYPKGGYGDTNKMRIGGYWEKIGRVGVDASLPTNLKCYLVVNPVTRSSREGRQTTGRQLFHQPISA